MQKPAEERLSRHPRETVSEWRPAYGGKPAFGRRTGGATVHAWA
jgi:hypothetical protein